MPIKTKDGLIVRGRKKSARTIRKGVDPLKNDDGSHSTHLMTSGETGNKKYPYSASPTIFPNQNGKTWTDLRNNPREAYSEASKRNEVYGFKSAKKAEKFSYGSWKEKGDRKDAMRGYREEKRAGNLYTQSEDFKKDKERLRSERESGHTFFGSKKK